jgi:hypothetical protein
MWGYDNFVTDRDAVREMHCRVCGSKCNVKRNDYGPTCFAAAVAKKYRYHDHFFCPHTDEGWHRKALDLVLSLENTPSKRVRELIRMDLEDLLKEKAKYFSAK